MVRKVLYGVLLAGLIAAPFLGVYPVFMMKVLCFALFAAAFNLLIGYTGLLSFGQAGFFAVGAYGCGKILLAVPNLLLGITGGVAAAGLAAEMGSVARARELAISSAALANGRDNMELVAMALAMAGAKKA